MLPVAVIVVLGGVPGLADHDVAIVIKKESCLLLNSQRVELFNLYVVFPTV